MIKIQLIDLEQVDPDENNPRREFGDIEALAESFQCGQWPGEPVTPIMVVKNGERYRIVDGERRFRAMRHLNKGMAHAMVCDDMDDANVALAMVATDDKRLLDEDERSRGVQQALLLGIAPEKVDRVAHVRHSAAVKRALEYDDVRTAGWTMSLEQLAAIVDAREAGDEEVAAAIAKSKGNWKHAASNIRQERKLVDVRSKLEAAVAELGAMTAKSFNGGSYIGSAASPAALRKLVEGHDAGSIVVVLPSETYDMTARVYTTAGGSEEEEAARWMHEQVEALREAAIPWYVRRMASGTTAACDRLAADQFVRSLDQDIVDDAFERAGCEQGEVPRGTATGMVAFCLFRTLVTWKCNIRLYVIRQVMQGSAYWAREAEWPARLADAMAEDGATVPEDVLDAVSKLACRANELQNGEDAEPDGGDATGSEDEGEGE